MCFSLQLTRRETSLLRGSEGHRLCLSRVSYRQSLTLPKPSHGFLLISLIIFFFAFLYSPSLKYLVIYTTLSLEAFSVTCTSLSYLFCWLVCFRYLKAFFCYCTARVMARKHYNILGSGPSISTNRGSGRHWELTTYSNCSLLLEGFHCCWCDK